MTSRRSLGRRSDDPGGSRGAHPPPQRHPSRRRPAEAAGGRPGGPQEQADQSLRGMPAGMTEVRAAAAEAGVPAAASRYRRNRRWSPIRTWAKAKFPVVASQPHHVNAATSTQLISQMDASTSGLNNLSGGNGETKSMRFIRSSPYRDRFRLFVNVEWNGRCTRWRERRLAGEEGVKNGAIGRSVQELGLTTRKDAARGLKATTGPRPVLAGLARRLNIPV